mmetsp:Transcript_101349/g.293093  ORF Transcript_101349/g.293093 Transcript_101349/m.293093 type:complete len:298 (-) Transcript_101349:16-909(-)
MSPAVAGLLTSGKDLRRLLERSGARRKLEGAEKLDLLIWLADQVKYCIEEKRRMHLEIRDLEELLSREGIDTGEVAAAVAGSAGAALRIRDIAGKDSRWGAKTAVVGLLLLRRREIARLGYDTDQARQFQSGDASFERSLALMPEDQVGSCFAMVPAGSAQDGRSPSAASDVTLPGQVETPRRRQVDRAATVSAVDGRRAYCNAERDAEQAASSCGSPSMRRVRTDIGDAPAAAHASGTPASQRGVPGSPMSYYGWSVPPPPPVPPPPTAAQMSASRRDGDGGPSRNNRQSRTCAVM